MGSRAHLWLVAALLSWVQFAGTAEVRVIDAQTRVPVEGAITFVQGESGKTDAAGLVSIPASTAGARATVSVRASDYARAELILSGPLSAIEIPLEQIESRTAYLSVQGVSNRSLRDTAVALQGQMAINALVIDMKDGRGDTPYPNAAHVAVGIVPEQKDRMAHINQFATVVRQLHLHGLYLTVRIIVFEDDRLARAHPEWTARDHDGKA